MSEVLNILPPLFVIASLVLLVSQRFNVPSIPVYLVSGYGLSLITTFSGISFPLGLQSEIFMGLAEAGASFLVFIASIKLSPSLLTKERKPLITVSAAQILLQLALGFAIGYFIGLSTFESFVLGLVASLSSSLVSLNVLEGSVNEREVSYKVTESISVIDDIFGALLVAVVVSGFTLTSLYSVPLGILLLAAAFILRSRAAKFLSRHSRDEEILLMSGVASVLVSGAMSKFIGVNPVLGSMSVGILLSKRPQNLELLDAMNSVGEFFSVVFFVSLGYLFSVPGGESLLISGMIVFSVAFLRPVFISSLLKRSGYDLNTSVMSALSLDHVSEISLLVVFLLYRSENIGEPFFQAVLSAAFVTMIITWLTSRAKERLSIKASKVFLQTVLF